MARHHTLLLAGLLVLALASVRAQELDAATIDDLTKKCDTAKLDTVTDAELEACSTSLTDGKACTPQCKTLANKAGKTCVLALIDVTGKQATDAEEKRSMQLLKSTVSAC